MVAVPLHEFLMAIEPKAIANKDNWSEVYNLADTYRQQQRWQQAASAFQQAIELRPDFFWSYHHLGDALSHLQQWQHSAKAYRRAVELDPSFFWSWHNLGDALTKLQQWQQAARAYRRAVELDSSFFWSWHNLGDALTKLQQWDRAIAIYLQAIQIQPEHQLVYQKLGTVFKQRGSLEDSIQYYRQLISDSTQNQIINNFKAKPSQAIDIANTLAQEHQIVAAIILYYMVLEIQPDRVQIVQQLANLLQQHHQLEQKIASRQQTLNSELLSRQTTAVTTRPKPKAIVGKIIIKNNCSIAPEQLETLCSTVGWLPRPLDRVQQSLDNSFSCITAWQINDRQKQLIGFARAVSDGTFQAILLDLVVHPDFQGRGIGKTIVKTLIQQLNHYQIQDITLLASPQIADFYHKLGFIAQPNNLQWMLWSTNTM